MTQKILLDHLWAVVDGRPVQQGDVLFVRLPDIISCLHQLLAALEDTEPDGITRRKTLYEHSNNNCMTNTLKLHIIQNPEQNYS